MIPSILLEKKVILIILKGDVSLIFDKTCLPIFYYAMVHGSEGLVEKIKEKDKIQELLKAKGRQIGWRKKCREPFYYLTFTTLDCRSALTQ